MFVTILSVIVGSSIGGVIAVALIATGAIAAIVRLHRYVNDLPLHIETTIIVLTFSTTGL